MARRIFLHGFALCLLAVAASLPAAPKAAPPQAEANLTNLFHRYLEEHFAQQPLEATSLGDHRFDHLLDDISAGARQRWLQLSQRTLKQLARDVDFGALPRDAQIDFEIFRHYLRRKIWLAENTRPFEEDPRVYNAYINDSVYSLLAQSTLPLEVNLTNAISRMQQIPEIIDVAKTTLRRPPRTIVETAIRQNRGAIGFYDQGMFALIDRPTPQLDRLRSATLPVLVALRDYQLFLEKDLLPRATGDWRLGKKKFNQKLKLVLDSGESADDVLAQAETEFARVEAELYVISRQVWSRYFPERILPPDDVSGRRLTVAEVLDAVGKEHGSPETLVADAQATVDRIRDFIRQHKILTLPEPDRCRVIEMPAFKRGNSLAYLESAPPLEPAAVSFYAISPPPDDWDAQRVESFLQEYNRHMLQVLTIHEAYPGHYVQLEYSNRSSSLIRRILGSGVFIEGWAVYTEQMMLDQGYGEGDPALRLSQLKFYLRAVANAILDHKMHCTRMTDDEALAFLTQRAFQSEGEARLKIIRAKQSSVQLSTYFVGRMAHYRLRQNIQRELGERFALDRYHEAVLGHGSVPVKYLPELVRQRLD